MPSGTYAKPSPAIAAFSMVIVPLAMNWPSTRTRSSRLPFSNSHAYTPPWTGRRRLMQLWLVSSCGFARGPLRKIRRGADDRHPHVRPDAHGNHCLCDLLAPAHARVKSLGDDIGQAVVDRHFNMDVGVLRQKFAEGRQQNGIDCVLCRRDANRAGRLVAQLR